MIPEGYGFRELKQRDAPALAAAYRRNRSHLEPWEPARDEEFFTEQGQAAAVASQLAVARTGGTAAWLLWHEREVVGRINLNTIVHGVLRSGSLGYWVDEHHQGRGLAGAAVAHACTQADLFGLHRVEAGTMLHNAASQRVLERAGFTYVGTAASYLFLRGAWQDHRLWQRILNDRPPGTA